jgi:hypothetical protein
VRARERVNETGIVRRLPGEVGISLRAGKTEDEEELQGPRTVLRCNPASVGAMRRNQCAVPQANLFRRQSQVGHFQHDAAHVLVGEEVVSSEL